MLDTCLKILVRREMTSPQHVEERGQTKLSQLLYASLLQFLWFVELEMTCSGKIYWLTLGKQAFNTTKRQLFLKGSLLELHPSSWTKNQETIWCVYLSSSFF